MCTSSLSFGTVSIKRLGEREYLAAYFDEAGGRCGREAQERTFSIRDMAPCSRRLSISSAFPSNAAPSGIVGIGREREGSEISVQRLS